MSVLLVPVSLPPKGDLFSLVKRSSFAPCAKRDALAVVIGENKLLGVGLNPSTAKAKSNAETVGQESPPGLGQPSAPPGWKLLRFHRAIEATRAVSAFGVGLPVQMAVVTEEDAALGSMVGSAATCCYVLSVQRAALNKLPAGRAWVKRPSGAAFASRPILLGAA
jgi:hypothetical protein